ncbi:MAG: hypothetical protein ACI965_000209 [Paraglaciecola sp.]|jgi:hypothetical protein
MQVLLGHFLWCFFQDMLAQDKVDFLSIIEGRLPLAERDGFYFHFLFGNQKMPTSGTAENTYNHNTQYKGNVFHLKLLFLYLAHIYDGVRPLNCNINRYAEHCWLKGTRRLN